MDLEIPSFSQRNILTYRKLAINISNIPIQNIMINSISPLGDVTPQDK
jgi:hypothetical protein